jgi:hypothetical protein
MKREITWITGTGKEAKVTVALKLEKEIWIDQPATVACCEMDITAEIEGMGIVGSGRPQKADHPVAVAKIGKLGINADNLARINAAIAEVEATPEWIAKVARITQAEKEGREYDKHRAMMRRVMGY